MALLVPVLPREVCERAGPATDIELVGRFRKSVSLNVDWRTGTVVDRTTAPTTARTTARNEKLGAFAA